MDERDPLLADQTAGRVLREHGCARLAKCRSSSRALLRYQHSQMLAKEVIPKLCKCSAC